MFVLQSKPHHIVNEDLEREPMKMPVLKAIWLHLGKKNIFIDENREIINKQH